MLGAIYTVISLQLLILATLFYLVLHRVVVRLLEHRAERRKQYFEPHVFNLLNNPEATESLERGLRPGDRNLIKELLLQQAVQLKGEERQNMTAAFEKLGYVESEISALHSRRWWRRLEAAVDLGIIQSQVAVPFLIRATRDHVEDVRLASVRALGQLNNPWGLKALLNTIEEGRRWTGSSIAEVLLGMGTMVRPEIVSRLESTTNVNARLLYVRLCGLLRIPETVSKLCLLLSDADKETRISAARALGQIGDVSAVEGLIHSLDDEGWEVTAQAAKALGALGDVRAVDKLKEKLSNENWWVRHNTASSLYKLGEEGAGALRKASSSGEGLSSIVAAEILAERALGV